MCRRRRRLREDATKVVPLNDLSKVAGDDVDDLDKRRVESENVGVVKCYSGPSQRLGLTNGRLDEN